MEFILASGNPHKAEEFNSFFKDLKLSIIPAPDKLEVIEDGLTFRDNALLKARAYYEKFGKAALADDSGLVIPAKPDILGVYSARFAPDFPDYKDKCQQLIEEMGVLEGESRGAYFVSYLCFYLSNQETFFFEGRVKGTISKTIKGEGGFGYDPIFIPEGREYSFAQEPDWKALNSHRAKSMQSAIKFFSSRF